MHRLSSFGAVVTHVSKGTSQQGFDAEWRVFNLVTVEGDLINRCEVFDEADLDAALARFDELSRPPALENAATRAWGRVAEAFNRRDLDAFARTTADGRLEDRRKGLHSVLEGPARQQNIRQQFELTPNSWRMEVEPIAIRGSRLALTRGCLRDSADADQPITMEGLSVIEVSDGGLVHDTVVFDPEDVDAAFAELDARYARRRSGRPRTHMVAC